ncbi:MAG: hypothetical protein Q4A70_01255 [Candidatus Saccharibacteria bacterium]|nr:hypothetical protein [Candidatus Saccharibacteria bacterium]
MKKQFIPTLVFMIIIAALITAQPTFAATCSGVETSLIECEGGGDAGIWHILILTVEILSIGIGITALIGILIFGVQYLTGGGDVARTTKAKRRMFEIVIGLVGWVLIYSICEWLMPGGKFNFTSNITNISLNFSKDSLEVGKSAKTTVNFTPEGTQDKTYSLSTENSDIASVVGNTVKCRGEGTTIITATSVNGKTATAEITCTKPVEPTNNKPGATPQDTWFNCDNCPSDGSLISQAQSASFDAAFEKEESSITYEAAEQLATAKGISQENFHAIMAWARTENYENDGAGNYFAYLCTSTMVNKALNGANLLGEMKNWADAAPSQVWFYAYADFIGSNDNNHWQDDEIYGTGQSVPGYYQSNLKIAYMALKYTYPNVNSCYGGRPANVVAHQKNSRQENIYVGW